MSMKEEEHFRSVFTQLYEYRHSGLLCDAVLVTGSRGVRAHSVILAATSPILKEALEAKVGSSLRYVYLPDYDFATLQVAVRFMYTGRLILNCSAHGEQEQLEELIESLRSLGLDIGGCEVEYESILNEEITEQTYSVDFSNFDVPKKQELSKAQLLKLSRSLNESDSAEPDGQEEQKTMETSPNDTQLIDNLQEAHDQQCTDTLSIAGATIKQEEFIEDTLEDQNVSKPFLIQSIKYLVSASQGGGMEGGGLESGVGTQNLESTLVAESGHSYGLVEETDILQGWKIKGEEVDGGDVKIGDADEAFQRSGDIFGTTVRSNETAFDMSDILNLSGDTTVKTDVSEAAGTEGGTEDGSMVYATELHGYDISSLISGEDVVQEGQGHEGNSCSLPHVPFVGQAYDEEDRATRGASSVIDDIVKPSAISSEVKKTKPLVVRSYRTFRQPFACGRCELRFSTRLGLKRHEEAHDRRNADTSVGKPTKKSKTEGYFPCDKCSKLFASEGQLQRHDDACHSVGRIYECRFCGSQFNKRSTFQLHERRHTGERPVLCHLCGRAFSELRLLRAHLKTPHDQYPCTTCSKMFVSRAKLAVHNLTEHGIWLKARTEKKRRRVQNLNAALNTFLCDTCGKSFGSSSSLATHSRVHKRICQVCEAKLNTETDLIEHMVQNHPGVEYVRRNWCELCAKELSSDKTYTEHMRLHSNDRPFSCVTCGKTFITRARLVFHLQKVHGSTGAISEAEEVEFASKASYPCEYCDKVFRWPDARTAHLATHTGLAPYQCKHCEKRFLYKGSLYAHVRIHTGELPFSCHICGKRFRQATHVKRHMHGHQGTKPYTCELCGKGYMGRIDLRNHYTRVHQVRVTQTRCNARNSYSFNLPAEMSDVAASEDVLLEEHCARTDAL